MEYAIADETEPFETYTYTYGKAGNITASSRISGSKRTGMLLIGYEHREHKLKLKKG